MPAIPRSNPIALERLLFKPETVRGTGETAPTQYMYMPGVYTPKDTKDRADDGSGTLENTTNSVRTREWGELSAKGPTNAARMVDLLRFVGKGGVTTPTTPVGTTQTELVSIVPTITADDLDSMTIWAGNPAVQTWQGAGVMLDELSISSDGSGSKSLETSIKGTGLFPSRVSTPSMAGATYARRSLMAHAGMQLWIDTTSAYGTTPIAGRTLKASPKIATGRTYDYADAGPGVVPTITAYGIDKDKRNFTANLSLELFDMTQYNLWESMAYCKFRLRFNGALIETVSATNYFEFINFDFYAPFDVLSFSDTNKSRIVDLTIQAEIDTTLGTSWVASVQRKTGS